MTTKNKSIFWIMGVLLITGLALVGLYLQKPEPKPEIVKELLTEKDFLSYAEGWRKGQEIRSSHIEVDLNALKLGIEDSLKGEAIKVSREDHERSLFHLNQLKMKELRQEEADATKQGMAFLEKNKSEPNVKTTESGLQYTILNPGKGRNPTLKSVVKLHAVGSLVDGYVFNDTRAKGRPVILPMTNLILGWKEALQLIGAGGKIKVFLPPELAYGRAPGPGNIKPYSVVIYEIELLEVK